MSMKGKACGMFVFVQCVCNVVGLCIYVVHTCVFAVYFTSAAWRNYKRYQRMRRKSVVEADTIAYTSERKTLYLPLCDVITGREPRSIQRFTS